MSFGKVRKSHSLSDFAAQDTDLTHQKRLPRSFSESQFFQKQQELVEQEQEESKSVIPKDPVSIRNKKKMKLITVIKGDFKGNPYKVNKTSRFINICENINSTLHKSAVHQVKKDAQAHGTYSLNPFAFYPKNIKNTILSLLSTA